MKCVLHPLGLNSKNSSKLSANGQHFPHTSVLGTRTCCPFTLQTTLHFHLLAFLCHWLLQLCTYQTAQNNPTQVTAGGGPSICKVFSSQLLKFYLLQDNKKSVHSGIRSLYPKLNCRR